MRRDDAIKLVRTLQRFSDRACKRPSRRGSYARQPFFPVATKAELREGEIATDITKTRYSRVEGVDLSKFRSVQGCLSLRRLLFQLRRHPLKKLPTVVRLRSGLHLLWDGNHRAGSRSEEHTSELQS